MPLFNICGVTSTNKTFQVAAVFLSGETEAQYSWAIVMLYRLLLESKIPMPKVTVTDRDIALMNAFSRHPVLDKVPHILCRWHINMNVLAKTKQYFPKAKYNPATKKAIHDPSFQEFLKTWNTLIYSPTVQDYEKRLEWFKCPGVHPDGAVQYCLNTWLSPWKEKIVFCYVDQHRHFRFTMTSVVESLH
ncbi:hypothetical protein H9Q72_014522, partial [Fusarium xylarioides]